MKALESLIEADARRRQGRLKSLTIHSNPEIPIEELTQIDTSYVEKVVIDIKGSFLNRNSPIKRLLSKMPSLNEAYLVSQNASDSDDISHHLRLLPKDRIESIQIEAHGRKNVLAMDLCTFQELAYLAIKCPLTAINELKTILSSCPRLKNLFVAAKKLVPDMISVHRFSVILSLSIDILTSKSVKDFLGKCKEEKIEALPTFRELYIKQCDDLQEDPHILGEFLLLLPGLNIMHVLFGLNTEVLQSTIPKLKPMSLRLLRIGRFPFNNSLHLGGLLLGSLIGLCPNLNTLELFKCALSRNDIKQMSTSIPNKTKLTGIRLSGNYHVQGIFYITALLIFCKN